MISQELYDETLLENQEAFDLSPSEAIDETLSQFATQKVDVSHLITHEHPDTELGEKLRRERRQFESWLDVLDRGVNKDGTLSCFDSNDAPAAEEATPESSTAAAQVVVEALDGIASRLLRGDATSSEGGSAAPSLPPYHYLTILQTSSSMYTLMSYLGAVSIPINDDGGDEDANGGEDVEGTEEQRELVLRAAVRAILRALVHYYRPSSPMRTAPSSSPRSITAAAELGERQPSISEKDEEEVEDGGDAVEEEEDDDGGEGDQGEPAAADVASKMEAVEAEAAKKARNLRCALRDSFAAFERLINLIDFYSAKAKELLTREDLDANEKKQGKKRTLLILRDLLRLGTAACKGCESNKVSFVRASLRNGQNKRQSANGGTNIGGGVWAVMSALQSSSCEDNDNALSDLRIEVQTESCKLLTVLCRFDDFRADTDNSAPGSQFGMTVSSAHDHATSFHRAGAVPLISSVASSALNALSLVDGAEPLDGAEERRKRSVSLSAASMSALRVLAINDEIVQTVVAAGSLDTARIALEASSIGEGMGEGADQAGRSDSAAVLASASLGLIRNLCGNDGIKTTLCLGSGSGGSDLAPGNQTGDSNSDDAGMAANAVVPTTDRHHPSALPSILATMKRCPTNPSIQEHGCGILAAMALRKPKNALVILESNGASAVLTAMKRHPDRVAVQRQGCLAIRNLASRLVTTSSSSDPKDRSSSTADVSSASDQAPSTPPSLDVREHLLDLGAEHVLRTIAGRHQGSVDEAYAALRDLGCSVSMARVEVGEANGKGNGTAPPRLVSSRVEMFGETKPKFRPVFKESDGLADVVEEVAASQGL